MAKERGWGSVGRMDGWVEGGMVDQGIGRRALRWMDADGGIMVEWMSKKKYHWINEYME